jgi:hypothetical protein
VTYAENTSVPVERSKAEIEAVLVRYGAEAFAQGWEDGRAVIQFKASRRLLRFDLPIPPITDKAFRLTASGRERTKPSIADAHAQELRRRWRALLLTIKAKLESVESGIETFEHAFMGNIVMPDGRTVAQHVTPKIEEAYETGRVPLMLPPKCDG